MIPKRTIGALIAILVVTFAGAPVSASTGQGDVGTLGTCIWDNTISWDAGSADNDPSSMLPGWDEAGQVSGVYVTTNKCADINIALNTRPKPAQTIGVRACFPSPNNVPCGPWRYWGPGFSGWLELNADWQQPSIPDGVRFYLHIYGVDPYTTGWIAF